MSTPVFPPRGRPLWVLHSPSFFSSKSHFLCRHLGHLIAQRREHTEEQKKTDKPQALRHPCVPQPNRHQNLSRCHEKRSLILPQWILFAVLWSSSVSTKDLLTFHCSGARTRRRKAGEFFPLLSLALLCPALDRTAAFSPAPPPVQSSRRKPPIRLNIPCWNLETPCCFEGLAQVEKQDSLATGRILGL